MRRRLPQHLLKRLHGLEKRRRSKRNPHMLVPHRLPMSEWSRLAAASQAVLKAHVKSDENGTPKYSAECKKYMSNLQRKY